MLVWLLADLLNDGEFWEIELGLFVEIVISEGGFFNICNVDNTWRISRQHESDSASPGD